MRKKKNVFRNDSPEGATDTSGSITGDFEIFSNRIIASFERFSDRLFVLF